MKQNLVISQRLSIMCDINELHDKKISNTIMNICLIDMLVRKTDSKTFLSIYAF